MNNIIKNYELNGKVLAVQVNPFANKEEKKIEVKIHKSKLVKVDNISKPMIKEESDGKVHGN